MRSVRGWVAGLAVALTTVSFAPAASAEPLSLEDVIRLHSAGVSDDIIMSEAIVTATVFDLSVDDILRLKEAGLSDRLLQFLVETGREVDAPADVEEAYDEPAEDDEGPLSADVEESQDESTTRVYVALNYRYSSWWYDHCWYDYWYYDSWYSPYRVSYCWGSWYPVWWSYSGCWASPSAGYRWHYDPWWNGSGGSWRDDWICYSPRTTGALSSEKWKSNRFNSSAGKSNLLAASGGLSVRDFGKASKVARPALDGKSRGERLALGGEKLGAGKPTKTSVGSLKNSRPTRSVQSPASSGGRLSDARKSPAVVKPAVRQPAKGPRPVKVVRPTRPVKNTEEVEAPRTPQGSREVEKEPASKTGEARPRSTSRVGSTTERPKSAAPAVRESPAPRPSPSVRSAPSRSSAGPRPTAPAKPAPSSGQGKSRR